MARINSDYEYEQFACTIATMSREEVTWEIMHFNGRFKLDFTEDYLQNLSLDRLRHILLAAKLHCAVN